MFVGVDYFLTLGPLTGMLLGGPGLGGGCFTGAGFGRLGELLSGCLGAKRGALPWVGRKGSNILEDGFVLLVKPFEWPFEYFVRSTSDFIGCSAISESTDHQPRVVFLFGW